MSRPTRIPNVSTPVRGSHPLRPTFPGRSGWKHSGIGLVRVRSPLLAESLLMSFPPGTEMFQFPGFASLCRDTPCGVGFPIRRPMDQSLFAAPHGLSQRTTSFIASQRQGIHRIPLRHLIALIVDVHPISRSYEPDGLRKDLIHSRVSLD